MAEHKTNRVVLPVDYSYPVHYLTNVEGFPNFSKNWNYSASYIAALHLFINWLSKQNIKPHHKHMDYGCGDGGFIYAVKSTYKLPGVDFWGVDIDPEAVRWAPFFSDEKEKFICDDIANLAKAEYDSGSLIEVYEHIPPKDCEAFLGAIAASLKDGASLFVTVPSSCKALNPKHFRHFDMQTLTDEFKKHFTIEDVFAFERRNTFSKLLEKWLTTPWWYVETQFTNKYFIDLYAKKHLQIKGCGRIAMVVRKNNALTL